VIEGEVLKPKRRAFADRRELRGLEVREADARKVAAAQREGAKAAQRRPQLAPDLVQSLAIDDEIRVVGDVAARSA
jgi:hypothetical protein